MDNWKSESIRGINNKVWCKRKEDLTIKGEKKKQKTPATKKRHHSLHNPALATSAD